MLPALRFGWMVRRQEHLCLPVPAEEPKRIDKGWTITYLTEDWLIYADSVTLHHSQISAIYGKRVDAGRFSAHYVIIVKTIQGHTYRWHLSQRKVKLIRNWLMGHQAAS